MDVEFWWGNLEVVIWNIFINW